MDILGNLLVLSSVGPLQSIDLVLQLLILLLQSGDLRVCCSTNFSSAAGLQTSKFICQILILLFNSLFLLVKSLVLGNHALLPCQTVVKLSDLINEEFSLFNQDWAKSFQSLQIKLKDQFNPRKHHLNNVAVNLRCGPWDQPEGVPRTYEGAIAAKLLSQLLYSQHWKPV